MDDYSKWRIREGSILIENWAAFTIEVKNSYDNTNLEYECFKNVQSNS